MMEKINNAWTKKWEDLGRAPPTEEEVAAKQAEAEAEVAPSAKENAAKYAPS